MKSPFLKLLLAATLGFAVAGCPTAPIVGMVSSCNSNTCANGCCSSTGTCVTTNSNAACGLSASLCDVCAGNNACSASGLCEPVIRPKDAGTVDSGVVSGLDAGRVVDAGNPCIDAPGDAVLGTFTAMNGATVATSGTLPAGVIALAEVNGALYGLTATRTVHAIGAFPGLALGPAIANIVPASVDAGADSLFISGYLASTGTQLLAGYTQVGADFPGQVAVIDVADGGVQFVNAPGNFDAVGIDGGFVINGGGLGSLTGTAVYGLRPGAATPASKLTSFDSTFSVNGSGTAAVTSQGVLLLGYSQSPNYENFVRALRPEIYAAALAAGTPFVFSPTESVVVHGFDVSEVDAFGTSAIIVRGGYDTGPYTTKLERVPLTLASGVDVVTVGTASTVLQENGSKCTRILFTSTSASSLYLAVQDLRGKRLVKLNP